MNLAYAMLLFLVLAASLIVVWPLWRAVLSAPTLAARCVVRTERQAA